ncbi:MAG: hypothetical protein JXA58_08035 [Dehalococcoidia bacterium]|nr:hypothetical protein [Dehalococcoidia bacterium]
MKQRLSDSEPIEVRYEVKGAAVYATPTRLMIFRDSVVSSHDYAQISGYRQTARSNPWLILCGVVLFAFGGTSPALPVAGAVFILLGVLSRARRIELLVSGVRQPVVLDGAREVLDPLAARLTEKGSRRA